MARSGSDYMGVALAQVVVKRIYGVVGDSFSGFTDSLRRLKRIDWIDMRHEKRATAWRPQYAMTRRLIDLGRRCSEVIDLRLEDIDWAHGTISLVGTSPTRTACRYLQQADKKAMTLSEALRPDNRVPRQS